MIISSIGPYAVRAIGAGRQAVHTGISVEVGDDVRTVSPATDIIHFGVPSFNADGDMAPASAHSPAPGLRRDSLICQVGARWYQGGIDLGFRATTSGELILAVNNPTLLGNTGEWHVSINHISRAWLTQAETFGVSPFSILANQPALYEWDALAQSKVAFVTHCPNNKEFFDRCHTFGIRCFPYVTFHVGYGSGGNVIGDGTNQPAVVSATYQGVDYNQHPEFYWYNPSGGIYFLTNTPVNTPPGLGDGVGFILTPNGTVTCPNVQVYQDAMVAWVDHLMRLGADGVFIDEITDLQPCSGPGLSPPKHSHIPGSAIEAYKELLSKVRAKVKQYKPDGAVLGNTTNPIADLAYMPKEFWDYLDAGMMESHLLPGYPPPPYPGAPPDNITISWKFWHDQANDIEVQTRLKKGIQILALCDLNQYRVAQQYLQIFKLPGPPKSDETDTIDPTIVPTVKREYAFLSYATARLSGLVWGAAKLAAEPVCADLHRLRLGHAVTDELTWPSPAASPLIYYRIFEHGIVLVNPDPNNDIPFPLASIASARSPSGYFIDVFGDLSGSGVGDYKRLPQDIVAMPVSFKLNPNEQKTIPKFAGRVFLFGADTSYQP